MNRRLVSLGIILLFLGTAIVPLTTAAQTHGNQIITVDDEPGDADYTSITEAMQHTQPGDTIEVYSGTYYENEIHVGTRGLTLQGVPHERGGGNDTGKPVVTSSENFTTFFNVRNNDVTITGFIIIDGSADGSATFLVQITGNNCTFSYNDVTGGWETLMIGLDSPALYPLHTRVIGNTIENTTIGISYRGKYGNISGNNLRSCTYDAISVGDQATCSIISQNNIQNCDTGILIGNSSECIISHNFISANTGLELRAQGAKNISIMMNQFQGCGIGIFMAFTQCVIQVYRNNFMKNWRDTRILHFLAKTDNFLFQRIFDENYYDSWPGFGSKFIWGFVILFEVPFFFMPEVVSFIPILTPWIYRDSNPASEPYDIAIVKAQQEGKILSLDPGWIRGPIWGRIDGYEFLGTENRTTLLFYAKNVHYFGIGHAFNAGLYPRHWVHENVSAFYSYFEGYITEHIIFGKISGLPNQ